jgi:monoamine oxidase
MAQPDADVLIVGGGVAGLTVARALRAAGRSVCILEARERLGGRILTLRDARVPLPLELGAEFVHGKAPHTMRIVEEANLLLHTVEGEHWRAQGGRLFELNDAWQRIGRVLARLDAARTPDRSFDAFLATKPGGRRWADARPMARALIQGFHAADPARISERALAEAGNPADPDHAQQHRIINGYDALVRHLAAGFEDAIHLRTIVDEIEWGAAGVRVRAHGAAGTRESRGRCAVVTVPIGVLKAPPTATAAIRFIPELPRAQRTAIDLLESGSVVRVTLLFSERVWEQASARLPAKHNLDRLHSKIVAIFHHDWQSDPFARGAYSYATVGGADAARVLARPLARSLFLAGEATAAESGTVEGALSSAAHAARAVLRALR